MTNIVRLSRQNKNSVLIKTLAVLRSGGLVVFPTDTVYGFLVDAKNEEAVTKLIDVKTRPAGRAISIFVAGMPMMKEYVQVTPQQEKRLGVLLPGPYTIVLPSKGKVVKALEAENKTLGVRIPDYKLVAELVRQFGGPITATSANVSGKPSVYSISALLNQLPEKKESLVDLIVDAGQLPRNKPSTVVDFTKESLKILRAGDRGVGETLVSHSEVETKKIAKNTIAVWARKKIDKPLVFILQGDLGAGKTIFVKGIGEYLGIRDIISPTFVIYYEYPIPSPVIPAKAGITPSRVIPHQVRDDKSPVLVHFDLYKIQESSEFEHLGIEKYLKKGNVLAIEWGEKAGEIIETLNKKAQVIYIHINYLEEGKREIVISK